MCGNAVFTMSSSSTSISWAIEITASASPRFLEGAFAAPARSVPAGASSVVVSLAMSGASLWRLLNVTGKGRRSEQERDRIRIALWRPTPSR